MYKKWHTFIHNISRVIFIITSGCCRKRKRSIFRPFSYISSTPISSISCLKQAGQKDPCVLVMPSATGKSRRGELGRGRNRAPNYKVTRENQSLLELSWYWRHQGSPDRGSMCLSGEEKEGGGDKSRILHQRKCATLCPNYRQSCGVSCYPYRCFSLNVHLPVLAGCPCHTYQGTSFGTSLMDYYDRELSNKRCSGLPQNIKHFKSSWVE